MHVPLARVIIAAPVLAWLGWRFLRFIQHAMQSIQYPFGLEYGEGIVWQQALLIPGPRMYGDINHFPFIVYNYPPVYHLAVRALAATGLDMLVAGRSISLLSTIVIGLVCARLAYMATPERLQRPARLAGATMAGLSVFSCVPVIQWSALMRVDMLAVALSFAGLWLIMTSIERPSHLYLGLLLFLLAIFTKQTSIAAPLASLPVLLAVDRRRTVIACSVISLVGFGILLLLEVYTEEGFLRHIVLYNVSSYRFSALLSGIEAEWPETLLLLVTIAGVCVGWRGLARERCWPNLESFGRDVAGSITTRTLSIVSAHLFITSLMIPMLGKAGAGTNYLIETMCVWSIFVGIFVAWVLDRSRGHPSREGAFRVRGNASLNILLMGILIMQMALMPVSIGALNSVTPKHIAELDSLRLKMADSTKPVLSEDMVLVLRAGKEVSLEPYIIAELARQGLWDQRLIIDRINSHFFSMIVTIGGRGTFPHGARYTPEVDSAIEAAYPKSERVAGYIIHRPDST
jgi:hypothetical protein